MSYNLKAKRKSDGKIFEYIKTSDGIHRVALNETTTHVSTTEDFMKEYEVISDTQEDKQCDCCGWNDNGHQHEPYCSLLQEDKGWREHDILNSEFALCQDIRTLRPGLIKLIERVQTQAYARGQADAYRESAKLAIDNKKSVLDLYPTADIHTPTEKLAIQVTAKNEYNNACEHISLAIEQLSSNKE